MYLGTTTQAFLGSNASLNLTVSDFSGKVLATRIEHEVFAPLRMEVKDLECNLDPERTGGRGYYNTLCFKTHAVTPDGNRLELADGGVADWTQKLLSNAKERLFISGLSSGFA